jgi:ATP-dependent DNA helicase RecG
MTARSLRTLLDTQDGGADDLTLWLGRLQTLALVRTTGRTQGTRYFVDPALLHGAALTVPTTLTRIEPHRLMALILEDLFRYPGASSTDVNQRIGPEISAKAIKRMLDDLAAAGRVTHEGERRWRRYRLADAERPKGQNTSNQA